MREKVIAFIKPCIATYSLRDKVKGKIKILRLVCDVDETKIFFFPCGLIKHIFDEKDGRGMYFRHKEIVIITKENRHLFSKKGVK